MCYQKIRISRSSFFTKSNNNKNRKKEVISNCSFYIFFSFHSLLFLCVLTIHSQNPLSEHNRMPTGNNRTLIAHQMKLIFPYNSVAHILHKRQHAMRMRSNITTRNRLNVDSKRVNSL